MFLLNRDVKIYKNEKVLNFETENKHSVNIVLFHKNKHEVRDALWPFYRANLDEHFVFIQFILDTILREGDNLYQRFDVIVKIFLSNMHNQNDFNCMELQSYNCVNQTFTKKTKILVHLFQVNCIRPVLTKIV